MQRSRLKNIINKSMQTPIGAFDKFKQSLPIEVDDNYRLESAWKAYGSPKDYKEALWQGLIQPIDENTYKFPSIGYNEETDEYEYLNKGKDNETVAKDIRVWDNDVIPLVKELKLGGFIRVYDEKEDCWKYSKNPQKFQFGGYTEVPSSLSVNKQIYPGPIVRGGKKPYSEWVKTVNPEYLENPDWYDLEKAYNVLPIDELEAWRLNGLKPYEERDPSIHLSGDYKTPEHPTYDDGKDPENRGRYGWFKTGIGWEFRPSPRQLNKFGGIEYYRDYWDKYEPESTLILGERDRPAVWTYKSKRHKKTNKFEQGGQMNVIPEGALHARKNNMEGAGEDFTAKGIPVVSNDGEQVAEIEKNEIVFNKSVTDFIEENYKKFYNDETSNSEKDELAIKVGKRLVKEILENTDDRTGLIEEVQEKM